MEEKREKRNRWMRENGRRGRKERREKAWDVVLTYRNEPKPSCLVRVELAIQLVDMALNNIATRLQQRSAH